MRDPIIASRPCETCRRFLHSDGPGGNRKIILRGGKPEPRHPRIPVPCDTEVGCPKGHYLKQKSLSPKNVRAYLAYKAARAAGVVVKDAIWIRNAGLIELAEENHDRLSRQEVNETLKMLAVSAVTKRGM